MDIFAFALSLRLATMLACHSIFLNIIGASEHFFPIVSIRIASILSCPVLCYQKKLSHSVLFSELAYM